MLLALLLPRLPLTVALAARGQQLPGLGVPVALGPPPLGEPRIGLPSAAAEASGVRSGMPLGEALTLCPALQLVPPDPVGVQERAARLLRELAALGLPVEEIAPGRVLIDAAPGLRLHGGPRRLIERLQQLALAGESVRIGAAPTRFAALMAARLARRRPCVLGAEEVAAAIAPLPVRLLHEDGGSPDALCAALVLVGIDRLGGVASLSQLAVRDRFGPPGVDAWRMARGEDGARIAAQSPPPLVRSVLRPGEPIATDAALEQAIILLVRQALQLPARGDAVPRLLRLQARLVTGESWLCEVPLRESTADPQRLVLALLPKARRLPAPAERLALTFAELARGAAQLTLLEGAGEERTQRLEGAAEQVRAAVGEGALLRIVGIDPASRLPERRHGLSPR
jgi:protein ImuB